MRSRHSPPRARPDFTKLAAPAATPIKALADPSFRPNVLRVSRVDPSPGVGRAVRRPRLVPLAGRPVD